MDTNENKDTYKSLTNISPSKIVTPKNDKAKDPLITLSKQLPPEIMSMIMSGKLPADELEKIAHMIPADVLAGAVHYLQKSTIITPSVPGEKHTERKQSEPDLKSKTSKSPEGGSGREVLNLTAKSFDDLQMDEILDMLQDTMKQILMQDDVKVDVARSERDTSKSRSTADVSKERVREDADKSSKVVNETLRILHSLKPDVLGDIDLAVIEKTLLLDQSPEKLQLILASIISQLRSNKPAGASSSKSGYRGRSNNYRRR